MKKYAYVRVSTKEQNVDRQLKALEPYDIPKKNIYCDYQSGKDFERPEYKKMLKKIREKAGNLTGTLIADLVLQILAYVAQTERDFIHQRQREGIAAAKDKGKKWGKPMEMPEQFEQICQMCIDGKITTRKAAEFLGVSHSTFYRRYRGNMAETAEKTGREAESVVSKSRLLETGMR